MYKYSIEIEMDFKKKKNTILIYCYAQKLKSLIEELTSPFLKACTTTFKLMKEKSLSLCMIFILKRLHSIFLVFHKADLQQQNQFSVKSPNFHKAFHFGAAIDETTQ